MGRLALRGAEIIATARLGEGGASLGKVGGGCLALDLSNEKSCRVFAKNLAGTEYRTVILLIGQMSIEDGSELSGLSEIESYFSTFVARYCWVINEVIEHSKNDIRILHVSSRSSKYGSWDEYYAAAKAAIEVFLRSKSKKTGGRIGSLSIAPSLIEGSGMLHSFEDEHIESHRRRAGGTLLTLDDVAREIERLSDSPDTLWDGRVVGLGPDYV
jgi:NAD(P)-dependent dehydrogenase (short-subunit alcohol dehydrogenase family)